MSARVWIQIHRRLASISLGNKPLILLSFIFILHSLDSRGYTLIRNRIQLVGNGSCEVFRRLRSDACDILETALKAVDPEQAIYNALRLSDETLFFEGGSVNLSEIKRVFVIGGGKAGV